MSLIATGRLFRAAFGPAGFLRLEEDPAALERPGELLARVPFSPETRAELVRAYGGAAVAAAESRHARRLTAPLS